MSLVIDLTGSQKEFGSILFAIRQGVSQVIGRHSECGIQAYGGICEGDHCRITLQFDGSSGSVTIEELLYKRFLGIEGKANGFDTAISSVCTLTLTASGDSGDEQEA